MYDRMLVTDTRRGVDPVKQPSVVHSRHDHAHVTETRDART